MMRREDPRLLSCDQEDKPLLADNNQTGGGNFFLGGMSILSAFIELLGDRDQWEA